MRVKAEFNDLEEMKAFAELIGGNGRAEETAQDAAGGLPTARQAETARAETVQAETTQTAAQDTRQAEKQPAETRQAGTVPVSAIPVAQPGYKLDDLAQAAMTLMRSGRQADLQALLARFGVDSLPALQTEQYGAFATALREMGARI